MHFATMPLRAAFLLGFLGLGFWGSSGYGTPLVTDETIKTQRDLTRVLKLSNGIPVIVREIPDSDILQVNVTFASGLKDLKPGQKVLNDWFWSVLPMAAKDYPKAKVFEITEKYGLEIGCNGGIEYSACGLGTLNDYWPQSLAVFAALLNEPSLTDEDAKLTKERLVAQLKNTPSDPGNYINEIVNAIFYPVGHPYRLNHDEALQEIEHLSPSDLKAYYQATRIAENMAIVVVTSLKPEKVVADLDKVFGKIPHGTPQHVMPTPPKFDPGGAYTFNDRDLPTAYIRIKLNAPAVDDKDAIAARLLYEILSEELSDEIRTKRSLSYAVHSFIIQYHVGIGVLSASTSKPMETLVAINDVLQKMKVKDWTNEELEEYKTGFATSFYLTQETHASLASALGNALYFYGDANEHYELPRQLDKVSPADIKRLANQWLTDLRIGVIYGRADFKDEWAQDLIKKNLSGAAPGG